MVNESVNHPQHYGNGKYECIDVMQEIYGRNVVKCFCMGNIFKYLWRWRNKNGLEDLEKAEWYLNKLIDMESEDEK